MTGRQNITKAVLPAIALLGMNRSQGTVSAIVDPYFNDLVQMLAQFAAGSEQLIHYEFQRTRNTLSRLNIPGAENILSFQQFLLNQFTFFIFFIKDNN